MVDISVVKAFYGTPFSIETSPVQNGDGFWNSTKVSIFKNQFLIGEYIRNYPAYGSSTFYPFEIDGEWYSLYSANYTATRVMKLNEDSIVDWCGEDPCEVGFCPVEFYVPRYFHYSNETLADCNFQSPVEYPTIDSLTKMSYPNFGFLSGSYWGDDDSWKLRFIDLSKIPKRILEITERFGYWRLPNKPLTECIQIDTSEDEGTVVALLKKESFRID